jgi:hypothetical protein
MKKSDLSRAAPLTVFVAASLVFSFTVVDAIAALGMKSIAAIEGSQSSAQSILSQPRQASAFNAARTRVC